MGSPDSLANVPASSAAAAPACSISTSSGWVAIHCRSPARMSAAMNNGGETREKGAISMERETLVDGYESILIRAE